MMMNGWRGRMQRTMLSVNTFDWRVAFVLIELGSAVAVEEFAFAVDIVVWISVLRSVRRRTEREREETLKR